MTIPPKVVAAARNGWHWQWNQLMRGLAPSDIDGNFKRVPSQHQNAIVPAKEDLQSREKNNLPRLIIGRSCPWAHRTWLVYQINNLEEYLHLLFAEPNHKEGYWKIENNWLECNSLIELYKLCGAPPNHRATVPVLIDPSPKQRETPQLLGNESAQLVEALNKWPHKENLIDLNPIKLQEEINNWQIIIQRSVNDGVYKCGFARNQTAYNKASQELFQVLNKIEKSLSRKGPWLCGDQLTLADIRLFPTLIRWESVYEPLFGCSEEPLWSFLKIYEWRKNFFNLPGVSSTCNSSNWRKDYFGALFPLNPSNIIPKGPDISKVINGDLILRKI